MKRAKPIIIICIVVFFLSWYPSAKVDGFVDTVTPVKKDKEAKIKEAEEKIATLIGYYKQSPPWPGGKCEECFFLYLDSVVLLSSASNFPTDATNKLRGARERLKKTTFLDPDGLKLLREAVELLNKEYDYKIELYKLPQDQSIKRIGENLFAAQKVLQEGNRVKAAVLLLEVALNISTPAPAKE